MATNHKGQPIAMRMSKVKGFRKSEIAKRPAKRVDANAIVVSDGLVCFNGVAQAGREHYSVVTGGGPSSVTLDDFTWVNTMIENVKNSMLGTYHAINRKHLPRYLEEFSSKFNRSCKLEAMIPL